MAQRAKLRTESLPRIPRASEPWVFPLTDYEIEEITSVNVPEHTATGGRQGLFLLLQKQLAKSNVVELNDGEFLRLLRIMDDENNSHHEELQVAFGRCLNSMFMKTWEAVRRAQPDSEQTLGVWS